MFNINFFDRERAISSGLTKFSTDKITKSKLLDFKDLHILNGILGFYISLAKDRKEAKNTYSFLYEEGSEYFWYSWKNIPKYLPELELNDRGSISKRFSKYRDLGILIPHKYNKTSKRTYFIFTPKIKTLLHKDFSTSKLGIFFSSSSSNCDIKQKDVQPKTTCEVKEISQKQPTVRKLDSRMAFTIAQECENMLYYHPFTPHLPVDEIYKPLAIVMPNISVGAKAIMNYKVVEYYLQNKGVIDKYSDLKGTPRLNYTEEQLAAYKIAAQEFICVEDTPYWKEKVVRYLSVSDDVMKMVS